MTQDKRHIFTMHKMKMKPLSTNFTSEPEKGCWKAGPPVHGVRGRPGQGDGLQDHQVQELHQNEQENQDKGKNYRFDM